MNPYRFPSYYGNCSDFFNIDAETQKRGLTGLTIQNILCGSVAWTTLKGCTYSTHRKSVTIGRYRNVRGLGKSMVVFRLLEKLRYSNERSTIF